MDTRGRTLCLITTLVCFVDGTTSWGQQTYNPTASDPATLNTAGGTGALPSNSGTSNTGFGSRALGSNAGGGSNTASGADALRYNTTGSDNTATGTGALADNTTGSFNTVTGSTALHYNTTGNSNTASGVYALYANTTGSDNAALGVQALQANTTGFRNTALGVQALLNNATGSHNTALGYTALLAGTGSRNTALGWGAGSSLTSGNDNIYLGHQGAASESKTMRLGTPSLQTRAFMAGITGVPVNGSHVVITSSGQLGVVASSARYKRDIEDMRARSADIYKLRPVTFRYKTDQERRRQYGLIAEEVAKVYPELVVKAADGTIESVQYLELIPMLLNEVQHQQQTLSAQSQRLTAQSQKLAELQAQNARLQAALVEQNAALAARLERLEEGTARAATLATR